MENFVRNFGLAGDVALLPRVPTQPGNALAVAVRELVAALPPDSCASHLLVRDWGLVARASLQGSAPLERRQCSNTPPRALAGLQPSDVWCPTLFHLRSCARQRWLGYERPLPEAERALHLFLRSLRHADAHAHSPAHAWGFWLCLLVLQHELHHNSRGQARLSLSLLLLASLIALSLSLLSLLSSHLRYSPLSLSL